MGRLGDFLGVIFLVFIALFFVVFLLQWKFGRVLRSKGYEDRMPPPPRLSLDASPRDTIVFARGLFVRRYADLDDDALRRWGDALLVCYILYLLTFLLFAWALRSE